MRANGEAGAGGVRALRVLPLFNETPDFSEISDLLADLALREARESAMVVWRARSFGLSPDAVTLVVDDARRRFDAVTLGHQIIHGLIRHQQAVMLILRGGSNSAGLPSLNLPLGPTP